MSRMYAIALCLATCGRLHAQEPAAPDGIWKLEAIVLLDGRELRGLVQSRSDRTIEFAEIVQRPGKPTHAIIRGIDPAQVSGIKSLAENDRRDLAEKFRLLRYRALIEAGRMEEVELVRDIRRQREILKYDGEWFTVRSSADDESTRRCIVRIEQIFRAFRTLLPPRVEMPRRLTIDLYASVDELRAELKSRQLDLDHPALYWPSEGRILAASELSAYAQQIAQVRRQAEELKRKYDQLDKAFAQSLAKLSGDLADAGFSKDEIAAEMNLRRASWKKEKEEALARMTQQMRRNEARFTEVTAAMFRRLYHEALHAYVDAFIYPPPEHAVPQWLHEGLAQVFESGQLEGDALRLDAPDPVKLAQLQAELKSGEPLPLTELLYAEGDAFTGRHDPQSSRRNYLYAWGVVYQLVFVDRLLLSSRLDTYVAQSAQHAPAGQRFERLVDRPLAEWEVQWRKSMLELPPPAR